MADNRKLDESDSARRMEKLMHEADVDRAAREAGHISLARRSWNRLTFGVWRERRRRTLADEYATLSEAERATVNRLREEHSPGRGFGDFGQ